MNDRNPDTVTKAELVNLSQIEQGFSKKEVREVLDSLLEEIKLQLESGREVQLSRFGTFILHQKDPRPGRNPRTGQSVQIQSRTVVGFHPSNRFKKSLNCS